MGDVVTNAISVCLQYQTDFTTLNDPSSGPSSFSVTRFKTRRCLQ